MSKTEIVLTKDARSARVTLRYDNPFDSTRVSFEGDPNILGVFDFYQSEAHGYFMGDALPTNAEWYMNMLPVLRLRHAIQAQVDTPPPFERFAEPLDHNLDY